MPPNGQVILYHPLCHCVVLHYWHPMWGWWQFHIHYVSQWCGPGPWGVTFLAPNKGLVGLLVTFLAPNEGLEGLGWHGYHMSSSITSVNFYHTCKLCITSEPLKRRCSTTSHCEGDPFCFHLGKPAGIFYEHLYLSVLLIYWDLIHCAMKCPYCVCPLGCGQYIFKMEWRACFAWIVD